MKKLIHFAYEATIIIKGIDGALETLAGLIIVITGPQRLYLYVLEFTAPELTANPHSRIVQAVQHGAFSLTQGGGRLVMTYLLIHGVLKLALAGVLLRGGGRWIFPVATAILSGFVIYLIHRWTLHPTPWLLGFALFDFLTLLLVLNEWRNPPRRRPVEAQPVKAS